jgi:hypothetical protein
MLWGIGEGRTVDIERGLVLRGIISYAMERGGFSPISRPIVFELRLSLVCTPYVKLI